MAVRITILFFLLAGGCSFLWAQTNYSSQMPHREALADDIRFWKEIFAHVSVDEFLIHDSEKLNIVYRRVGFDSTVSPRAREKVTDAIKDSIAAILKGTALGTWPTDSLPELRKEVLGHFGENPAKAELLRASKKLRAQQGIREKFMAGITRSYAYLPHIRQVFKQHKLPEFLVYLPHVESSFTPDIVSHVGAGGMWQFMRPTARSFMKVNRVSDERFDPYKSTHGAARLLAWNYKSIGDWALAITAYNHGLAGMKRAKRRYGSYLEIREKYLRRSFGFASKNFYPEVVAVVEILDSVDVHFPNIEKDPPQFFQEIKLPRRTGLPAFARRFKIDLDELKSLNPGYRRSVWRGQRLVPAKYTLRLPLDVNAGEVLAALGASPADLATTTMALPQPAGSGMVLKKLGEAQEKRNEVRAFLISGKAGTRAASLPAIEDVLQLSPLAGESFASLPSATDLWSREIAGDLKPSAGMLSGAFVLNTGQQDRQIIDVSIIPSTVAATQPVKTATPAAIEMVAAVSQGIRLPKPLPTVDEPQVAMDLTTLIALPGDLPAADLQPEVADGGIDSEFRKNLAIRLPQIAVDAEAVAADMQLAAVDRNAEIKLEKTSVTENAAITEIGWNTLLTEDDDNSTIPALAENISEAETGSSSGSRMESPAVQWDPDVRVERQVLLAIVRPGTDQRQGNMEWVAILPFQEENDLEFSADLQAAHRNPELELVNKPGHSFAIMNVESRDYVVVEMPVAIDTMVDVAQVDLRFGKPGIKEGDRRVGSDWHTAAIGQGELELSETVAQLFLRENLKPRDDAIRLLPGETLGHLAEWLSVPVWRLRQLNSIRNSRKLRSGQKIQLDFRATEAEIFLERRLAFHMSILSSVFEGNRRIRLKDYRVRPGDNLWTLASRSHKFPVNLLLYFNEFDKLERLYPGDVVRLPVLDSR